MTVIEQDNTAFATRDAADIVVLDSPAPPREKPALEARCATDLLHCIGTQQFDVVLERMLTAKCGAVQFASYRVHNGRFTRIAGLLDESQALRAIAAFDMVARSSQSGDAAFRMFADSATAALRACRDKSTIWVVVQRAVGTIPSSALDAFANGSALVLAAHAKHIELLDARDSAVRALASIVQIEECLTASSALTSREIEVCARVLYGLSTLGIAVDLSLSEETVRTYRKRAYQRLLLGTERQLLTWYLRQWTRWDAAGGE